MICIILFSFRALIVHIDLSIEYTFGAMDKNNRMETCSICGGTSFTHHAILDEELVELWELSASEKDYINDQQGMVCNSCGCNLRSMTLANALQNVMGVSGFFKDACQPNRGLARYQILEINEACHLTPYLKKLPNYRFIEYPQFDMQNLAIGDESYDIVIHSDTLEHVPDSIQALRECRRILKPGGVLAYTVPMVVGRLTRSRKDLPASYHGDPAIKAEDFLVQREYGADAWTEAMNAGFKSVILHRIIYPASIAIIGIK